MVRIGHWLRHSSYRNCSSYLYAVSGRFSFLHPPHGSTHYDPSDLNPSPRHAMNPLLSRRSLPVNSFGYYCLAHGHSTSYM